MIKSVQKIVKRNDKPLYDAIFKIINDAGESHKICRYSASELKSAGDLIRDHEYDMSTPQITHFWAQFAFEKEKQLITRHVNTTHDIDSEARNANQVTSRLIERAWNQHLADERLQFAIQEHKTAKTSQKQGDLGDAWKKIKSSLVPW